MKILMSGAGAPGGPGIIKALNEDPSIILHVCDANPQASGRFLSSSTFHLVPHAKDDGFIPNILDICLNNGINYILPLVTGELSKLAVNKELFIYNNIYPIVSDFSDLNIANDKGKLYHHLVSCDIPVPNFHVISCIEQFKTAIHDLKFPSVPVVMKPCIGNGSRGVRVIDENVNRFDLLFNYKPSSLVTTLNEVFAAISNHTLPELVISEYLPGPELTIDTIVKNGQVLDLLIRRRSAINSGISVSGAFIVNDEVEKYICSIVKSLPGLEGPIGFQVKQSVNGEYLLLECNPRIQGTSVAAIGLGINLPLRAIFSAAGKQLKPLAKREGVSFCRYYNEVFYDSALFN
jgi:carbamoyl-phosphate synthase large subunit